MSNFVRGIIGVLVIAVLGLGAFTFNQSNTLTDTQNNLADVEISGTTVADTLNTANDTIDQLTTDLDSANAEITEVSSNLDSANAEITEIVEAAAATATQNAEIIATAEAQVAELNPLVVLLSTQVVNIAETATTQAMQSSDDLATVNAEITEIVQMASADATQNANVLATANAEIIQVVESADATATQYSIEIVDVESTVSALNMQATNTANIMATQTSDLATAQALLETQNSQDDTDSDVEIASLGEGFILFEASDFDIYVPENFIIYDLRTHQEQALNAFSKLGFAYSGIEFIASVGELYIITGASDTPNEDGSLDNLIVTRESLPYSIDMEEYLEFAEEFFPDEIEILELSVITIDGEDVGLMQTQSDFGFVTVQQLIYVYNVDNVIYSLGYTTNDLADNRAEFEASLLSFTPHD
ncbi:MAG: hypothetical protein Phog2KO_43860 [Phototrophicaceae bacterium]